MITFFSQNGQNIFDLVIQTYGSLDFTYKFITDNPILGNVGYNFVLQPNTELIYDPTIYQPQNELSIVNTPVIPNVLSWAAQSMQSLFDICLNTYGTLDKLYKLLTDNKINSLLFQSFFGTTFNFDPAQVLDFVSYQAGVASNTVYSTKIVFPAPGKSYNISYNISFN